MCEDHSPDLSVIIVNWNVRDLLRKCLRSLHASPEILWAGCGQTETQGDADTRIRGDCLPVSLSPHIRPIMRAEVIVVDNASSDGSPGMVAAEFPWVRLIANSDNRGFTGGNNQGILISCGRYVLFLNPDTEVVGDALARMVACLEGHPEIGALGPRLRYEDGAMQPSRRRFPTLATGVFESTPLAWHWPDNPWARRYHMDGVPFPTAAEDEVQVVDWVVGAALLARRETLDQVGGFDEGFFMYSDELDWCQRVKAAGWQVVYFTGAQVLHHEGKSSEQVVAVRHIRFHTSRVRYFRKHRGQLAAETLRYLILAMFSMEWVLEAVKRLVGSKRGLRRERMRAYGELMRSGLR